MNIVCHNVSTIKTSSLDQISSNTASTRLSRLIVVVLVPYFFWTVFFWNVCYCLSFSLSGSWLLGWFS